MSATATDAPAADARAASRRAWVVAGTALAVVLGAVGALYHDTFAYAVESWGRYKAYSHGYLIPPIALYMVWVDRERLLAASPRPAPAVVLVLALGALAWAASGLIDLQLGMLLAAHGLVGAALWLALGRRVALLLAYPWAYLVLALPIWWVFIGFLQENTADAAAAALRALGIPVFHEGFYLTIPEGVFEVAEICAGMRYLLATLSIAGLYAFLNLRGTGLRLAFVAAGAVISIVFNWIRVISIIVAGHLTDMQSTIVGGDGHIPFGWFVFAVALVPLFLLGAWLQRVEGRRRTPGVASEPVPAAASPSRAVLAVALALPALGLGPLLVETGDGSPPGLQADLAAPPAPPGWAGPLAPAEDWRPLYPGAAAEVRARYERRSDGQAVDLYVAFFDHQRQGAELVSEVNRPYQQERWGFGAVRAAELPLGDGRTLPVSEVHLRGAGGSGTGRLVWTVYRVGGVRTASERMAKVLELWARLHGRRDAAVIALSVPVGSDPAAARDAAAALAGSIHERIEGVIDRAVGREAG